jgi:hypothetical protein
MARLFRLLPEPSRAHQPGSVDPPKITLVSLATVAERAQPLQRTVPSWRAKVQCSGCRRFTDGVLAHVGTPGGPTSTAQQLFSLTRSAPTPCLCPSLTWLNRRGTDPYPRWCGRGGTARCPPIPINGNLSKFEISVKGLYHLQIYIDCVADAAANSNLLLGNARKASRLRPRSQLR